MRKFFIMYVCAALLSVSCRDGRDLVQYANPMVGTAYTGHTFPGAAYPFGLMQPSPHTGNYGWEHCSGYNNDDSQIWGFGQNHLNGTGCPDLGDLMFMPFSEGPNPDFRSAWDKETEFAVPGYYSVTLTDNNVDVELTCSPHVAMHRYHYKTATAGLYIDFQTAQTSSEHQYDTHVLEAEVNFESPTVISGHHHVTGWVQRHFYYVIEFSVPVADTIRVAGSPDNMAPKYVLMFPEGSKELVAKVAMSTVSIDAAKANMAAEVPGWNFSAVRKAASDEWNRYFHMIEVDGTEDQLANFYTSFYHLLIQPNNIADVSGSYRGADDVVRYAVGGRYFSTFSLWDTFRAAHPFYALMMPELAGTMVDNMLDHCDAQGFLPIWALWGKENYCMIGNHAVPVVVDACLKNLPHVNRDRAFAAVRKSLTEPHYKADWDVYDKYGYYPFDIINEESASRTLECGYDDYCAAVLAGELGLAGEQAFFMKRSGYWKNLFDTSNGLVRGKDSNGNWRTPFDKFHLSHGGTAGGDYTEGNAWQYTWHVMHDLEGLVELMGGRQAFMTKLDSLFIIQARAEQTGFTGDVTGLIGQYAHGNEPSHHVAYLYSRLGDNDRTAELVREIFDKFYRPRPDGLCGNDDCGQMSAWYMFSAMGFYPLDSISGEYVIGAPQIAGFRLRLHGGNVLDIRAAGLSDENRYVKSAELNGKPLENNVITYSQIMAGGELRYVMSNEKTDR
ncbi:MAG: GH92 family glycosyl hydrolase [Bacteroidales bacterium]|nr:GH92 family glycosyl hydrolase [Bacteroidales bacterium]